VWQPAIITDEADHATDVLPVRLSCATEGADLRYTLDGSAPGPNAALYAEPVSLTETTTVRARAYLADDRASLPAQATFTLREDTPRPANPAETDLPSLKLWLSAAGLGNELADGDEVEVWRAEVGPDAAVPDVKLVTRQQAVPPTLDMDGMNGRPAVSFSGGADLLAIPGFFKQQVASPAFSVFLVMQSGDPHFGISGNSLSGLGGIPRLYLTRSSYTYNNLRDRVIVGVDGNAPAIVAYQHDGDSTASAWVNGLLTGQRQGFRAVESFGGGHLAMPFSSGSVPRAGKLAEVIVFNRALTDAERESIEAYLSARYGISEAAAQRWE
jgi:hypothetical protein